MADVRDYTVNGNNYKILIPSARKSMKVAEKASLLLGPVVATLGLDAETGMEKLSASLRGVDSEAVDNLLMSAASISNLSFENQTVADSEGKFDVHFHDKRQDVFPVLVWCLWENIKDFLPSLAAYGQILKARFGEQVEKA